MSHDEELSQEMQNAFVDGQLDAADWTALVERMGRDDALRRRVCELRTLKDMTRSAYSGVHPGRVVPAPGRARWARVAAVALVFALAGWLAHDALAPGRILTALRGVAADRILVHIASSRGEVVDTALQEVEDYLRDARAAGRQVKVEIVANNSGMDILRTDTSAYAARLERLRAKYPNLTYIACNQTADRLREKGTAVKLLPGVHVAPTALDEIVKRMQEGWVYIRA